jgi:hypothetical protein
LGVPRDIGRILAALARENLFDLDPGIFHDLFPFFGLGLDHRAELLRR